MAVKIHAFDARPMKDADGTLKKGFNGFQCEMLFQYGDNPRTYGYATYELTRHQNERNPMSLEVYQLDGQHSIDDVTFGNYAPAGTRAVALSRSDYDALREAVADEGGRPMAMDFDSWKQVREDTWAKMAARGESGKRSLDFLKASETSPEDSYKIYMDSMMKQADTKWRGHSVLINGERLLADPLMLDGPGVEEKRRERDKEFMSEMEWEMDQDLHPEGSESPFTELTDVGEDDLPPEWQSDFQAHSPGPFDFGAAPQQDEMEDSGSKSFEELRETEEGARLLYESGIDPTSGAPIEKDGFNPPFATPKQVDAAILEALNRSGNVGGAAGGAQQQFGDD